MNYFVKRGDKEYGPYTLAVLQQYVAQGSIAPHDLARSEGMTDWAPVADVVGNVPVTAAPSGSAFGTPVSVVSPSEPPPPKMHWAVLLLLSVVTFGIFWIVWLFVQAAWVRKINPKSKAALFFIAYLVVSFGSGFFKEAMGPVTGLVQLGALVIYLVGLFQMRGEIEEYYGRLNPFGLHLSAAMTFFFNIIYFQYHFTEIREAQENLRVAVTAGR